MLNHLLKKQKAIIKIENLKNPEITKEIDDTHIFPSVISVMISDYTLEVVDFQFTYNYNYTELHLSGEEEIGSNSNDELDFYLAHI